jgi:hypothetical protein
MTAVTMQTTWRCQKFRRIKYQPAEMKMVLIKLSEALTTGKSEMENICFAKS